MEEKKAILHKEDLAMVSGGDGTDETESPSKLKKKKGTTCSMCGSINVKREQKKHHITQVICRDCGYQYQYLGIHKEEE